MGITADIFVFCTNSLSSLRVRAAIAYAHCSEIEARTSRGGNETCNAFPLFLVIPFLYRPDIPAALKQVGEGSSYGGRHRLN